MTRTYKGIVSFFIVKVVHGATENILRTAITLPHYSAIGLPKTIEG